MTLEDIPWVLFSTKYKQNQTNRTQEITQMSGYTSVYHTEYHPNTNFTPKMKHIGPIEPTLQPEMYRPINGLAILELRLVFILSYAYRIYPKYNLQLQTKYKENQTNRTKVITPEMSQSIRGYGGILEFQIVIQKHVVFLQ